MHKKTRNEPTIAVFSYHALTSLINKLQYKAPHPVRIIVIDCMLNDVLQKAEAMEKIRKLMFLFPREEQPNSSQRSCLSL